MTDPNPKNNEYNFEKLIDCPRCERETLAVHNYCPWCGIKLTHVKQKELKDHKFKWYCENGLRPMNLFYIEQPKMEGKSEYKNVEPKI